MYLEHFGLKCKPFEMTPDPRFYFGSSRHRIGLSVLEYALLNRCILAVLTGEVGCGKTMILRHLLERGEGQFLFAEVATPHQAFGGVSDWIYTAFADIGVEPVGADCSFAEFVEYLRRQVEAGYIPVLVIDEAQNMSLDDLEAVRVLTNLVHAGQSLISLLLVGQPELRRKLRQPELRQFVQRITADYDLKPLSADQVLQYVIHRERVAGSTRSLFSTEALDRIVSISGGVPRVINLLCDLALVYAYAENEHQVSLSTVEEVFREKSDGGLFWLPEPAPVKPVLTGS